MTCFKVISINIRSIYKNLEELKNLLYKKNIDIALIQETWVAPGTFPNIIGYKTFNKDRIKGGGGVAILLKDGIKGSPLITEYSSTHGKVELIAAKIGDEIRSITVVCMYIPPDATKDHLSIFEEIDLPYIVIGGDLNAHHPRWSKGRTNHRGKLINKFIDQGILTPVNTGCLDTLLSKRGSRSTPDLILVGAHCEVKVMGTAILERIGSDHLPILAELMVNFCVPTISKKINKYPSSR